MKWKKEWTNKRWGSYTIALCIAVVFYVFLTHLSQVSSALGVIYGFISPVIAALIIAYVLDPVVRFFEKWISKKVTSPKAARNISVLITFALAIVVIIVIISSLVPQLINSIMTFIQNLDGYMISFNSFIHSIKYLSTEQADAIFNSIGEARHLAENLLILLRDNASDILQMSYSIGANIVNTFISFILAMYMLTDKNNQVEGLKKLFHAIMDDNTYKRVTTFLKKCNFILIRFIGCDLLDGLIVGIANAVFMTIMGMNYVPLISVIVGITNLAPTFGPFVGGFIGALILLLVNPMDALVFLIFTLSLQQIDGYVIKPVLFADAFSMPSMWILISIVVGGRMFGVWGIILGIPVAAIIDFSYQEIIYPKLLARKNANKQGT